MAFITTEEVANIRRELKARFPKYKFSIRRLDYSKLIINLLKSDLNLLEDLKEQDNLNEINKLNNIRTSIQNGFLDFTYIDLKKVFMNRSLEILKQISDIAYSQNYFDKSNANIDYFDCAYYVELSLGNYSSNKPYQKI